MAENLPAPIDRAALERILQRAAELQASEHELGERMSPDEVLALGKEVGIPSRYLQQAMLEERTRGSVAGAPSGMLDRVAGPGSVVAHRVVVGTPEAAADALVAYIEQNELLCVQRRQARTVTFEPIGGFQAAIRRSSAALGKTRPFLLDKASTVAAAFTPLEDGYVHVLMQADVRGYRAGFVGGAAALTSTAVAAAAVLGVLDAFLPIALAPLPLGAGLGWGVLRQYAPKLHRIQLGLERALDHLEQGHVRPKHELPKSSRPGPGILGLLVDEVRKNMK